MLFIRINQLYNEFEEVLCLNFYFSKTLYLTNFSSIFFRKLCVRLLLVKAYFLLVLLRLYLPNNLNNAWVNNISI